MSAIKRHLSYANVVATLALFIALGAGTVWAAGGINGKSIKKNTLPGNRVKKNTLPGNRLQNGTVKGGKVDVSTLGQVPSAKVADAANDVSGVFKDGPVTLPFANTTNTVGTLRLPIGKFFITAKFVARDLSGSGATDVECFLFAGADNFDKAVFDLPSNGDATIPLETVAYLPLGNDVVLDCNRHSDNISVSFIRIQAVSASDIQRAPSP